MDVNLVDIVRNYFLLTRSAYLVRRVPPSDKMNEVLPSLSPTGLLLALTGDTALLVL